MPRYLDWLTCYTARQLLTVGKNQQTDLFSFMPFMTNERHFLYHSCLV